MTVKELIKKLQELPEEYKKQLVFFDGHACRDCAPEIESVSPEKDGKNKAVVLR